ncbi:maltose alpha-D-glucosyltransferase [Tuwongella immobilis]|uniref:maltose alpha-D-glucosyltransferase n=1 Tax=Tuwongella immobilis TaxID=692036 RepID=A0A6C2YP61_9BACT|nr:trehalose synthase : Trehalose synthase OS=Crinalium epipsammum PCC 9333 GN=Cri9333_4061 PE=4 SV=1: Alpha-amylase: APH [Tuwongella immobilis]VTS04192.1 trehalose synthase : Trehalose synthase OS=Crinalium epipsammum PCC 9333 GN=Cri9333_4061 PE=4 SV=1: Alpha-amylase: APH [Tuwongella immobilis]
MPTDDPQWYKDAVIYEVHVRAFHDSVGDGMGDFRGLTQKLDYLEDLGVTAVWLLPFYPSPLRDDGYDIADYTSVHPHYGTLDDFKAFLDEAHRRGIKVITELVINHTSDQHPWFQRARQSPRGSVERDFYVWNDTPDKFADVPIIFPGFETSNWAWDPVAKQYYWHRFYSHQPDLNYDNPAVWDAIMPVVDFWFDLGVDGMRLDAVPYLYEREGTSCENLPETHHFLKSLRKHVEEKYPDRMFLAEVNLWPEDAVEFFGQGDECHMVFHFPLMPRLFMALHQEDRFPIIDILAQTPAIPESCQWCLFLRNHDELTLAMITDEERDYMLRAYAQERQARIFLGIRHRLVPLLKNDRRRIEMMNALLFSMPGTPVVYYGDEIGMGDNIYLGDRNGVRTPMQWSSDRNAGFSRANPQKLYLPIIIDPEYHYEAVNVEAQQNNPSSLLWWMKRLIALRKRYRAFGRGSIQFLLATNPKILAFIRVYQDEVLLVVANLSRFVQYAELDLSNYRGMIPEELFGRTQFPAIGDGAYPLTMGPHGFYWFALTPVRTGSSRVPMLSMPEIRVNRSWEEILEGGPQEQLEGILVGFLTQRQTPGSRQAITNVRLDKSVVITISRIRVQILFLRVEFRVGLAETVLLPVLCLAASDRSRLLLPEETAVIARIVGGETGDLVAAQAVPEYNNGLLRAIRNNRSQVTENGQFVARWLDSEAVPEGTDTELPVPVVHRSERNNFAVIFGESFVLKTFHRAEEGTNPDLEVGRYLQSVTTDVPSAPVVGAIELIRRGAEPITLAVLHRYVPNQGNAWQYTLDLLSLFYESVAANSREQSPPLPPPMPMFGACTVSMHDLEGFAGGYINTVRLLANRTAELHKALAAAPIDSPFAKEIYSRQHQRSVYQSMRNAMGKLTERLERERDELPPIVRPLAERFLAIQRNIVDRFQRVLDPAIQEGFRIRCHGDYHLGQLLYTGNNFVVIDFEGDVSRRITDRKIKRSPLRDVAGMLRSFDYAAQSVLRGLANHRGRSPGVIRTEDRAILSKWADAWCDCVSREFVSEYRRKIDDTRLLPPSESATSTLIELFLLEKAILEIDYDLAFRPEWAVIPLRAILRLMGESVDDLCEPSRIVAVN